MHRPHLRRRPLPWPSTDTCVDYEQQGKFVRTSPQADTISPNQARILVSELIDLRTRLGKFAFVEHKTVAAALEIAKVRKGQAARVRAEAAAAKAAQIAAKSALKSTVPGFGPRGGLPRDKPSLIRLCKECGLSQDGLIGELKERLTEYVDLIGRNDRERSIKTLEQAEQEVRAQGDLEVRARLAQALAMSSMGQQGDPSLGKATGLQSGSVALSSQAQSSQPTPGPAIVINQEQLDSLITDRLRAAGVLWQKDVQAGMDLKLTETVSQVLTQHQLSQLQTAANSAVSTALEQNGGMVAELSAATLALSAQQSLAMTSLQDLYQGYAQPPQLAIPDQPLVGVDGNAALSVVDIPVEDDAPMQSELEKEQEALHLQLETMLAPVNA